MSFVYFLSLHEPTTQQLLEVIQNLLLENVGRECSWMLADNGVQFSVRDGDTVLTPEEYPVWAKEVRGDSSEKIEELFEVNRKAKEFGISLYKNGKIDIPNYRRIEIDIWRDQIGSSWQARGSCDFELLMVFLERMSRVTGAIGVRGEGVQHYVNVFPGADITALRATWDSFDEHDIEQDFEP